MADLADVEGALKAIVVGAVYPNGTAQPSAILLGAAPLGCAVMRGWPHKDQLKRDLAAGIVAVSIWPRPGERNVSRFPRDWETFAPAATSIEADVDVDAGEVTLSGPVSTPQNLAVIVNGVAYIYPVQAGDTLASAAAGLAALIAEDNEASSDAATVSIVGATSLEARVGGEGTLIRELKRQERQFQLSVWSATPQARDAAAAFVDRIFAGLDFITLIDGCAARIQYQGTAPDDDAQAEGAYRRDLVYLVEYATTETQTATEVIAPIVAVTSEDPG